MTQNTNPEPKRGQIWKEQLPRTGEYAIYMITGEGAICHWSDFTLVLLGGTHPVPVGKYLGNSRPNFSNEKWEYLMTMEGIFDELPNLLCRTLGGA